MLLLAATHSYWQQITGRSEKWQSGEGSTIPRNLASDASVVWHYSRIFGNGQTVRPAENRPRNLGGGLSIRTVILAFPPTAYSQAVRSSVFAAGNISGAEQLPESLAPWWHRPRYPFLVDPSRDEMDHPPHSMSKLAQALLYKAIRYKNRKNGSKVAIQLDGSTRFTPVPATEIYEGEFLWPKAKKSSESTSERPIP